MKVMLAAALVAIAGQAQALSCMQSDVARTFGWASEAEERYVVLLGAFAFSPPVKTQTDTNIPQSVRLPATFSGKYLGADGFVTAPTLDVTLNFECLAHWCGSISHDEAILTFVEQTADGYVLNVNPCHSTIFAPDDGYVQTAESCMRGTGCDERTF
ncbi:hypothetical protein OAN307_c04350 [Octadecabacter antarcticus 307]|uniref:Uncharacterized protein n=1 Tax=Octadecabacter antarcticus 307 TaxID=391626 RepID=M9R765_9RHOB|nr:hypothetical protein [Octadecabacter antarcticus]AGI66176.1 hypothetical protein OAN307_c04350 [Octadecabacter antarcticus 307]